MEREIIPPTIDPAKRLGALKWTLYVLVPVAAVVVAYLATHGPAQTPNTAEHQHAIAPAAASAQPVMLSAAEARRIGG